MAEEELQQSQEYLKGFNDAYRLSQSMPQIFKGLEMVKADRSDYTEGFDNGRKQYLYDQHHGYDQSPSRDQDNTRTQNR